MASNIAAASNRLTRSFVGRQQLARRRCLVAGSMRHDSAVDICVTAGDDAVTATCSSRRRVLLGFTLGGSALTLSHLVSPAPVLAKTAEKEATIINDPAALKAQLEAQYQQWSSGQYDAWLAGQPETLKWQSSYNGVTMKLKGRAGAKQYFDMLNSDLDIQSYKALAIFVDNDGDEATVVVEASGLSRRTQQPFKTVFLHAYTIGPMGRIIKFKETTDTALMAQLVPPPPPPAGSAGAGAGAGDISPQISAGEAAVEPGTAARSA